MLTARKSGRGYKTNTFAGPQRAEVIKQPNELKSWYSKEKDTELFRVWLSEQKRVDSQREKKGESEGFNLHFQMEKPLFKTPLVT